MPISAQPGQCRRLLSSSSVITTPVSLVKELVENSIDADSGSIDVLISPNTIDRIEVRDNGVGIPADDLPRLGRRGYTSKLSSLEELRDAGVYTLGFRGEALASMSCLGMVRITSRTKNDHVASIIQLSRGGEGIANKQASSAPVGTTVLVTNLFDRLPVRKRISIGESQKAVTQFKTLLLSYAMARPHLRLSLRVLGTQSPVWTYSPRPGAGVREAVLQGFGAELTTQCQLKSITFDSPAKWSTSVQHAAPHETGSTKFVFDAFLPDAAADFSRICKGVYISVNCRPLSIARGIGKRLLSTFRAVVTKPCGPFDHHLSKNPFLVLNIQCPAHSFDVTVESAKQDVLFMHEQALVDEFERFCRDIYENPETRQEVGEGSTTCPVSEQQRPPAEAQEMGIEAECPGHSRLGISAGRVSPASCARSISIDRLSTPDIMQPSTSPPTEVHTVGQSVRAAIDTEAALKGADIGLNPPWVVDMSAAIESSSDSEDHENLEACGRPHLYGGGSDTSEPIASPLEGLNPWTIAKLNAPRRKETCRQVLGGDDPHMPAANRQFGVGERATSPDPGDSVSMLVDAPVADGNSIFHPNRPGIPNSHHSKASGSLDPNGGVSSLQGASLYLDEMTGRLRGEKPVPLRRGRRRGLQGSRHREQQASRTASPVGNGDTDRRAPLRRGITKTNHIGPGSAKPDTTSPLEQTQVSSQVRRSAPALPHHRNPLRQDHEMQPHMIDLHSSRSPNPEGTTRVDGLQSLRGDNITGCSIKTDSLKD